MLPLKLRTLFILITLSIALVMTAGAAHAVTLHLVTDAFGEDDNAFHMATTSSPGTGLAYDSYTSSGDGPANADLDDGFAGLYDLASNTEYLFEWDLAPGDYVLTMYDDFGDGLFDAGSGYALHGDGVEYVYPGGDFEEESIYFSIVAPETDSGPPPDVTYGVPEPTAALVFMVGLGVIATRRQR
jgi:hypothetical protein